ncbi:MAG: 4-hydroxy-3-methylbut-2-enyl diphosphate reductase [Ignavibacteria bacterium]
MKKFDVPPIYKSNLISKIKVTRQEQDPKRKDFSPTFLDFEKVVFIIPRHFGFCYGVQNAIEITYKVLETHPDKNIYLLSEIIHNPEVNTNLKNLGVNFLEKLSNNKVNPITSLQDNDILIIPAFGTTVEIYNKLKTSGRNIITYDTTCPFVEKVWNRSSVLGKNGFTVIIHGKHYHEETQATFSHSQQYAPTIIIRDLDEAKKLGEIILEKISYQNFFEIFSNRFSKNFDPYHHLQKIGIVNQTTMLASETQEIANYLKNIMVQKYGAEDIKEHFFDTRDTLCYATHENQESTIIALKSKPDIAVVIGGYNSSNTSQIVKLCQQEIVTYFISSPENIATESREVRHYDIGSGKEITTKDFLPLKTPVRILVTSGASCPDILVEETMKKIMSFYFDAAEINRKLNSISV